MFSNLYLQLS